MPGSRFPDSVVRHPAFSKGNIDNPCGKILILLYVSSRKPQRLHPLQGQFAECILTDPADKGHLSLKLFQMIRYVEWSPAKKISFRKARSEEHTSELQSRGHLVCR